MRIAKAVALSDEERTTLVRWSRGAQHACTSARLHVCTSGAAGEDRAGRRGRTEEQGRLRRARLHATHRRHVAKPLRGSASGRHRAGRSARRSARDHASPLRSRDHSQDRTGDAASRHATVDAVAGQDLGLQRHAGASRLEGQRPQAAPHERLQGLERSAVRREARRRRRPVPEPSRASAGVVVRREESDPGARPHSKKPAAASPAG